MPVVFRRKPFVWVLVLVILSSAVFSFPTAHADTQNSYRWRNDDGSETSATWAAAENTPLTGIAKYQTERLRLGVTGPNAGGAVVGSPISTGTGAWDVAITPDGTHAYSTNVFDNTVSVIDTATNSIIGSPIAVGAEPRGVAVSPDGTKVYVSNRSDNSVSVISTSSNTVTGTVTGLHAGPWEIVFAPDGTKAYVAAYDSDKIDVIRTSDDSLQSPITGVSEPWGLAVDSAGTLYSSNYGDNTVSTIVGGTVTDTVSIGHDVAGIAVTPDGSKIFVASRFTDAVYVIRTSDDAIIDSPIAVGSVAIGVAMTPDGSRVLVSSAGANTVKMIDTTTDAVTRTISGFNAPVGIGIAADGSKAYVANDGGASVSEISLATSPRLEFGLKTSTCAAISSWTQVAASGNAQAWRMAPSFRFADGAATTDNAGVSNGAGSFTAGQVLQHGSQADPIVLDVSHFTEEEFSIAATSSAANGGDYCFRLTNAGDASGFSYTNYAEATVATAGDQNAYRWRNDDGSESSATFSEPEDTPLAGVTKYATKRVRFGLTGPVATKAGDAVSATVGVGATPWGDSITPDGTKVYVANYFGNSVSVIRTSDHVVTSTISVGTHPYSVVVTPDGTKAFVGNYGDDTISVIDTSTDAVVGSAFSYGQSGPGYIAFTPDGAEAFVTNYGSNSVSVIDTTTHATIGSPITVGTLPEGVAITPDGAKAYVANLNSNSVSVIDTTTNAVIGTIAVGTHPWGVAITPDGAKAYVANFGSGTLSVIDTATDAVVGSPVSVSGGAIQVAVTHDGATAYVSGAGGSSLAVLDAATDTVTGSITLSAGAPFGIAVSPADDQVFVTQQLGDDVAVISGSLHLEFGLKTSTCAAISSWTQVASSGNAQAWRMTPSFRFADGAATTDNAGLSNGAGSFTAGRILQSGRAAPVHLDASHFTEEEFSITATSAAADGGDYCFRLTDGDASGFTYSNYAEATVAAGPDQNAYRWRNDDGSETAATFSEPENTPLPEVVRDVPKRVRFGLAGPYSSQLGNGIAKNIPAAGSGTFDMAVTPDGGKAYVTNPDDGTVSVVDVAADAIIGSPIVVGTRPQGVAVTPDGAKAYVVNKLSGTVSVIDTSTDTVVGSPISIGTDPTAVAVTPDGARAYVTVAGSNEVVVIDTATDTVVGSPIATGSNSSRIAIAPNGAFAYVTNPAAGNVTVIDTTTNTVVGSPIAVGATPYGIAFTPDGARAYVANSGSATVSVIDTATNTVVGSPIAVGNAPLDVAVTPDGARAYVVNEADNSLSLIDTATNTVVGPPNGVGVGDFSLTLTPGGTKLYLPGLYEITMISAGGPQLEYGVKTSTCAAIASWTAVPASPSTEHWRIAASAHFTDGDPTTNVSVGGGVSDGASTFVAGQIKKTTGQAGAIAMDSTQFTEEEFSIAATSNAIGGDSYCFRLTDAGDDSGFTYTNYAEASVAPPAVQNAYRWRNDDGSETTATWSEPENTPRTDFDKNTVQRLRFGFAGPHDRIPNDVSGSIVTGGLNPHFITLNPAGTHAYVTNINDNTVSVIDTSTDTTVGSPIAVGTEPEEIAITPDGSKAYVTNSGDDTVSVIDTSSNTVVGSPIAVGNHPKGIVITPDGAKAYVANFFDGTVSVIDTSTDTVTGSPITFGFGQPSELAITPDGSRVYTGCNCSYVSVIDTSTDSVVGSPIAVGESNGIAVSPDGTKVYATDYIDGTVAVISTATNTVVGSPITVGGNPMNVTFSADGAHAYVTNNGYARISVIDAANDAVTDASIQLTNAAEFLAITADGEKIYATGFDSVSVGVITPSIRLEYGVSTSTCASVLTWNTVPAVAGSEAWQMAPSTNFTDGEATTDVAGGVTNGAATFVAGTMRQADAHAPSPSLDAAQFTEVEFSVEATNVATFGADYCFRLTDAGNTASISYANYAEAVPGIAPFAITDLAAAPGNGHVSLSWTAPTDDGPAITAYDVHYSTDGFSSDDQTCTDASCTDATPGATVPGLTNGVLYTFRVFSTNAVGTSPASNEATATPAAASMDAYRWRNDDGTETTATWSEPENAPLGNFSKNSPQRLRIGVTGPFTPSTGGSVIATVPVGANPGYGIAVTPDGTKTYAVNAGDGTVSVIDDANDTIIGSAIAVGSFPLVVAITPSGARAYVTNLGDGTVSVIDTSSNSVVGSPIAGFSSPAGIAVTPDGLHAYVVNNGDGTVSVIDTGSNTIVGSPITVGASPGFVAINHAGDRAYVTNIGDGTVSVIDTGSNTIVGSPITVGGSPFGIAVTPDDAKVYVLNAGDGTVSVIDTSSNMVVGSPIAIGTPGYQLAVSPDGAKVFVPNGTTATVTTIDTTTDTVIGSPIAVGNGPTTLAVSPSGTRLYVGASVDNAISVVSLSPGGLRLEYGRRTSTCAAISSWTQVPSVVGADAWRMTASTNFTDGDATTNVAGGLTDGAANFVAGQMKQAGSQVAPVALDGTQFTEVEYSVEATDTAPNGSDWCFRVTDGGDASQFDFASYAEVHIGPQNPTTGNAIVLSRLKVSTPADARVLFNLPDVLNGRLTVTFPTGFSVLGDPQAGSSSGCLSAFGHTSSTVFATKSNCSGPMMLGGFQVLNPAAPGAYHVTWVNDDPGGGEVYIVLDDQVVVDATVDPSITFNVGADTGSCDGAFAGNGGNVGLGTLTPASVASSDAGGVAHVCTRVTTNAAGVSVSVASKNGALKSASTIDQIASAGGSLTAGTANYGLCAGSTFGDSGEDGTVPVGASPVRASPFNGASCTASGHDAGALTTSAQPVWTLSGPSQNAFFRLFVKAAISPTTPAHADYGDTLTFTATGLF